MWVIKREIFGAFLVVGAMMSLFVALALSKTASTAIKKLKKTRKRWQNCQRPIVIEEIEVASIFQDTGGWSGRAVQNFENPNAVVNHFMKGQEIPTNCLKSLFSTALIQNLLCPLLWWKLTELGSHWRIVSTKTFFLHEFRDSCVFYVQNLYISPEKNSIFQQNLENRWVGSCLHFMFP